MKKIIELLKKYNEIISYIFFGVCSTLVNIGAYYLFYEIAHLSNVLSTIIALLIAITFAYFTNKLFVFKSKSFTSKVLIKEMLLFFGCRLLTGILDVGVMYFAVDLMNWNPTLWKLFSNILVIIANYIANKLFVFRKK